MAAKKSREGSSVAPENAADELRRCTAASGASSAGVGQSGAERAALISWAREGGLLRDVNYLAHLPSVGSASEHTVYHEEGATTALKATHPNRFGHSMRRPGMHATAAEYFDRWAAHNAIFGDDAHVEAVIDDGEGNVQIVMRQPWIESHGTNPIPLQYEIDAYMAERSFRRLSFIGPPLYYNPDLDLHRRRCA